MTNMTTRNNVLKRCEDIIKSENDDRFYRGLVLNNKMKVLLISAPTTNKSAAALDVNIGGMCDPDDLPGLAHFCEHMLALGTEKYPEQNDYKKYLSENGGINNALTYFDHTMYHFDVNPTYLTGALERFVQFFLTPLFTDSLVRSELNVIHSEYLTNLACDYRRFYQLEKSSANSRHPYSKFVIGNRETLDVLPKQMGINVRQRLFEFYEKYYSANVMSLCVLGKETLDELEEMVVSRFSHVRNKEIDIPIFSEHPFDDEHFRTRWYIVPIRDTRFLHVIFPIPDLEDHYRTISIYYIQYLLRHEGKGSLFSTLKTRRWCNIINCGKQAYTRYFCFFYFEVDLTEEGFKHVDDIITLMFQYINMLKKHVSIEWIYNEYRDLEKIKFRFIEKEESLSYVSARVSDLWNYPMKEILSWHFLLPQWKPELQDMIDTIIRCLTPQNIRVYLIAKAYEDVANETERWYGTKYKKEKISTKIIDMWENAGYNSEFHLPAKNEFIPSRLDLKPLDDEVKEFPTIIGDTLFVRLWFKQDDKYLVPKAKMYFQFVSPYISMGPVSFNLTYIYNELLQDLLTEYVYPAKLAGLHCSFKCTIEGIIFSIYGYDDKQYLLLEKIVDGMLNVKIDSKRFEILKEGYIRYWKNSMAQQPFCQANNYLDDIFYESGFTCSELLHATAYLTVDIFEAFIQQLFSKVHVECLIHGNIIEKEALDIARMIESKLKSAIPHLTPLWQQHLVLCREVKLDDGRHFLLQIENKYHENSFTEVYYQIGMQSTESNVLLELLVQIINEPCFNILRTQEQLGYIAFSRMHKLKVMQGLIVAVQSNKHPRYVEKRIDSFLHSMLGYISTMSKEEFEKHRNSLIGYLKPEQLFDLTDYFWSEITLQQYNFDRTNIEVDYLKTVTQEQLLNFFEKSIHSPKRRKLSLHIISTIRDNDKSEEKNDEFDDMLATGQIIEINDIFSFKHSQSLYPALEPYEHQFSKKGIHSSICT